MNKHAGYSHLHASKRGANRVCNKSTAKITYLHNALGQRVFKSEPQIAQTAPSEEELGPDFVAWLKKNYAWMFDKAQSNATVGQSYFYGDGALPEYALLAEYGNGSASGTGRFEYIWLPTDAGGAIPIGLFKSNRLYSIHTDHLNTPRLVKDDDAKPVWQWPYSAFGDNKPTGILKATTTPNNAITQDQATSTQLKATAPTLKLNLRYPGQYFDEESNLNYNYNRSYVFGQGRYSQADPIGLEGGVNRFGYVEGNPLMYTDPRGLDNPGMGPYGPGSNNYGRNSSSHWQRSAAMADFIRNFNNMRDANTKMSDKYFHCKANCEATRRGRFGEVMACDLSDAREFWDQYSYKWDSAKDSLADQAANVLGRNGALSSSQACSAVCNMFRPNGLPAGY